MFVLHQTIFRVSENHKGQVRIQCLCYGCACLPDFWDANFWYLPIIACFWGYSALMDLKHRFFLIFGTYYP